MPERADALGVAVPAPVVGHDVEPVGDEGVGDGEDLRVVLCRGEPVDDDDRRAWVVDGADATGEGDTVSRPHLQPGHAVADATPSS